MTTQPAIYILASKANGTLYVGVTSDLPKRIWEHREDLVAGFTRKYGVHTLVYYEQHEGMIQAIQRRSKQLRKPTRVFITRVERWKLSAIITLAF
ncbi:MAG: GIY-YIG nuclease family protein [Gammaproteobacteria bacterium]